MTWKRLGIEMVVGTLFICAVLISHSSGASQKHSSGWTHYHNDRWGFCVSYPSNWLKEEGFDGAGILVEPSSNEHGNLTGSISIGALPNQLTGITEGRHRTLKENFQVELAGLKDSQAEGIQISEQRETQFLGGPAMLTEIRYHDPHDKSAWTERTLWANRNDVIYTLTLKCRPKQLSQLETMFNQIVSTFRFKCKAR